MRIALVVGVLLAALPATAAAQATNTWVSGVGDDANPCSRTAPCKTFAGAILKTATGGQINVLDPGSFGAVTIAKAITIEGGGVRGVIIASGGGAGVIVNAPGATVVLRNLGVNGAGTTLGFDGIRIVAAGVVHIESCVISNFQDFGIDVENGADVFVKDTIIRRITDGAIRVEPAMGPARLVLDTVRLEQSGFGLRVGPNAAATVRTSAASGNVGEGWWAEGDGVTLSLTDTVATANAVGIRAGTNAVVRTLGVTVTGNTTDGSFADTGGSIVGFTENLAADNGTGETCEVDATTAVACPNLLEASITCPAPVCPQPICPGPPVPSAVQTCGRCRTKKGVTTCTKCSVQLP